MTLLLNRGARRTAHAVESAPADDAGRSTPPIAESELVREVAACLPALPVLQAQLGEAVKTVENSVVAVCDAFMQIARQADAAVGAAKSTMQADGSGDSTISELVTLCRGAFDELLAHIERSSGLIRTTTERIGDVERGMGRVADLLKSVDDLAGDIYIIALNGTIEAARAGEFGAAFGVVAAHTRELAQNARQTSETIREIVVGVSQQTSQTAAGLVEQAEADTHRVEQSRARVAEAVSQLTTAHTRMSGIVEGSLRANRELASDVARVVTTMQFQDAVSQRVGHVSNTLGEMRTALERRLAEAGAEPGGEGANKWIEQMSRGYVMQAERSVLTSSEGAGSDSSGSVELF